MSRQRGSFTLGGTIEPLVDAPLDARLVVATKADRLDASSYPYKYLGMPVWSIGENSMFVLIAADVTDEDSWKEMGSGGSIDSRVLKFAGSIAFANLPQLAAGVVGNVYNITDNFVTTADFLEGAGKACSAGTNVAICDVGTAQSPSYKYDVLTSPIDTSLFMLSVSTAPASPSGGDYIFYHGTAQGNFAAGDGIYKYDLANTRWVHQDLGFVEQGMVVLPFSTTTTYDVNDRCYKDGQLWKCTTAHTGEWASADFTAVILDDVIPKSLTDVQMAEIKAMFHPVRVGNIAPMKIYSPIEHQVDVWQEYRTVNGVEKLMQKPVYGKRIEIENPVGDRSYPLNISNIDFSFIDKAIFINNENDIIQLDSGQNASGSIGVKRVTLSTVNNIYFTFMGNIAWDKAIVFVEYTKTTDEWEEVAS